jgi:hypothetical protein
MPAYAGMTLIKNLPQCCFALREVSGILLVILAEAGI